MDESLEKVERELILDPPPLMSFYIITDFWWAQGLEIFQDRKVKVWLGLLIYKLEDSFWT